MYSGSNIGFEDRDVPIKNRDDSFKLRHLFLDRVHLSHELIKAATFQLHLLRKNSEPSRHVTQIIVLGRNSHVHLLQQIHLIVRSLFQTNHQTQITHTNIIRKSLNLLFTWSSDFTMDDTFVNRLCSDSARSSP
ncbi:unnamed protein product [Brassica napus]|uniref:(rape) hypothetical protein n=1 Tax=Brassica napus TaxID=3708 RepID=A0A816T8W8_BRANA|nr:unnamed protein product [Brassica napus]